MHCPDENTTYQIWRVLDSSNGISSWTPLKPQHSNPNPLVNQLWCIDFLTPPTPLTIPYRLPAFLESSLNATQKLLLDSCKIVQKQSEAFHTFLWHHFFPSLKQNCIAFRSSKVSWRPDCISEIHQLWQSGFSRLYSNCCFSCSFEPEIIKIVQKIVQKRLETYLMPYVYICIYIYIYIYNAYPIPSFSDESTTPR